MTLARTLRYGGRGIAVMGVVILLFVIYQLWGTSLQYAQAQSGLRGDFGDLLAQARQLDADSQPGLPSSEPDQSTTDPSQPAAVSPGQTDPANPTPITVRATTRLPTEVLATAELVVAPEVEEILPLLYTEQGEAMARLRIPSIGMDEIVVAGTNVADLRKGPGHYAWTPLPGQPGNVSIAGHRTTYGAPFGDINLLEPGAEIFVQTVQGEFTYIVLPQGSPDNAGLIVTPDRVDLLRDQGDNRLTLTSCHPRFSSRQRIVVQARLVGNPAAPLKNLLNGEAPADPPAEVAFASEEFPAENPATGTAEATQPGTEPPGVAAAPGSQSPNAEPSRTANPATGQPETAGPAGPAHNSSATHSSANAGAATTTETAANTAANSAAGVTNTANNSFGTGLNGDRAAIPSAVLWGLATLLVWTAVWLIGRRWLMRPTVAMGALPVLFCLFVAFNYIDRAIPSY